MARRCWMENTQEKHKECMWVLDKKAAVHVGEQGCQKGLCRKPPSIYLDIQRLNHKGQGPSWRHWDIQKSLVVRSLTKERVPSTWNDIDLAWGPKRQFQIAVKGICPNTLLVNVFTVLFTWSRHSCVGSWLNSYHERRICRSHNAVSWVSCTCTQTIKSCI